MGYHRMMNRILNFLDSCQYRQWGEWSNCSNVCSPLAEKTRKRLCLTDTCSSGICRFGSTIHTITCNELPCCEGGVPLILCFKCFCRIYVFHFCQFKNNLEIELTLSTALRLRHISQTIKFTI